MTRILGIDPGSRITGFGVVELVGQDFRYLASGCLRLQANDLPRRLAEIFRGMTRVIEEYAPAEVAIEQVFVKRNVASALKLGQARGAAICAAVHQGLEVAEYAPTVVKQAVVGQGRASKDQVQYMVALRLGLPALPQEDAADALAIALCHGQSRQLGRRLHGLHEALP